MPIRPEMRGRYPAFWRGLSWVIRHIRAQGACEWCGAENHKPHPVTGSRVVLTVAHLVDMRPEAVSDLNLAALCQRCHLRHDAPHHWATRRAARAIGDLFSAEPAMKSADWTGEKKVRDRFMAKVAPAETGCWLWTGRPMSAGYGHFHLGGHRGQMLLAHRVSWMLHRGPVSHGLCVLHRCDVPLCVNPDHLFLGDRLTNMLDMVAKGRDSGSKKTHCPKGHPYNGDNLYLFGPRKVRNCKQCKMDGQRRRRARLRTQAEVGSDD